MSEISNFLVKFKKLYNTQADLRYFSPIARQVFSESSSYAEIEEYVKAINANGLQVFDYFASQNQESSEVWYDIVNSICTDATAAITAFKATIPESHAKAVDLSAICDVLIADFAAVKAMVPEQAP